jgi:hypothetical protein
VNAWINLNALWKIIVLGLVFGAGGPALFAIGLRSLSLPPAGGTRTAGPVSAGDDRVYAGNPAGLLGGLLCFAIILAAIGYGIYFIVEGS